MFFPLCNVDMIYNIIIKKLGIPILFVDDNSIDGTRSDILNLKKKNKLIKYLFRKKKLGIGSAHKDGIKWAYKNKFDICFTMDADRTHNPFEIKKMLSILKQNKAELIITSRFIKKKSLSDWPYIRKVITKIRYNLVKYMLKTNLDSSGGFRCYNLKKIKKNTLF